MLKYCFLAFMCSAAAFAGTKTDAVVDANSDAIHDAAQRCIKYVHDTHHKGDGKHMDQFFTGQYATCRADLDTMSKWVKSQPGYLGP
jgi:hypothetical protein